MVQISHLAEIGGDSHDSVKIYAKMNDAVYLDTSLLQKQKPVLAVQPPITRIPDISSGGHSR